MKNKEIRELTSPELAKQLEESRREYLNLRIQSKTGQLENPARIPAVRRLIARLLTEKNARKQKEVAG
ncbi:MAG: 50S ribosomal protein L29 [Lentisphaeria bacterium]|nr:50S ribosomal protein L29 [Lentisphaeria bacterium]